MKKAIFLDKDGTLIPDIPYNADPSLISISDNALEGLRMLKEKKFLLIVVTNQSGVAKGYFDEGQLRTVFDKLESILLKENISIAGFYYCPHHPGGSVKKYAIECACMKPMPGLILKAARELEIDLNDSWVIGDILNDVEAGARAGCRTVLIDNGNETEWMMNEYRRPDLIARNINEAARQIAESNNSTQHEKELADM